MRILFVSTKEPSSLKEDIMEVRVTKDQDTYVDRDASGRKTLVVGSGDPKELNRRKLVLLARRVIAEAKARKAKRIALSLSDFRFPRLRVNDRDLGELLAVNFEMANYEFVAYRTPPEEGWILVQELVVYGPVSSEAKKGFERGQVIGEAVNATRDLVNTPGIDMPPRRLGEEAQRALRGTRSRVLVLGKADIEKLGMGGVLGVSRGSAEEPRFIVMEYWGAGRKARPLVFVGKGVTFDTGGLNVKPSEAMLDMHMDMSGGAAVIQALALAARVKLKKNVVGLIPAVENMPSGSGIHPGDILRTVSGKTIEVLNTDAEGRVILADALGYAKRYNPKLVVDVATLTGAAMGALGQRASAVFATDESIGKKIQVLGEESGDYVWPLPLWPEYEEEVKGTMGDWINTGKTRYGGAVTAAAFLRQFAEGYPWVHLDIAPRMTSIEGEYLAKGAAGAPVRLLAKMVERL